MGQGQSKELQVLHLIQLYKVTWAWSCYQLWQYHNSLATMLTLQTHTYFLPPMIYLLVWSHNYFDLLSISSINNFYTGERFRPLTHKPRHAGEQMNAPMANNTVWEERWWWSLEKRQKKERKKSQLLRQNKITFRTLIREGVVMLLLT